MQSTAWLQVGPCASMWPGCRPGFHTLWTMGPRNSMLHAPCSMHSAPLRRVVKWIKGETDRRRAPWLQHHGCWTRLPNRFTHPCPASCTLYTYAYDATKNDEEPHKKIKDKTKKVGKCKWDALRKRCGNFVPPKFLHSLCAIEKDWRHNQQIVRNKNDDWAKLKKQLCIKRIWIV